MVGEPGIGKSRLVEEFRARIRDNPHLWVECGGDEFSRSTPFQAVTQILNQGLGWRGDESPTERIAQLERGLELAGLKLGEAVPLIAEMLGLPIPDKRTTGTGRQRGSGRGCKTASPNAARSLIRIDT